MGAITIFVSHNNTDTAFADALVRALRGSGADVWYDEHNLGLAQLRDTIDRELRARRVYIVVLSDAALKSEWVRRETSWFLALRDLDKTRIILPMLAESVNLATDMWTFLLDFVRIEGPDGTALPQSDAINRTLVALGLILDGEAYYPEQVTQAIRERYRELGCITGLLGASRRLAEVEAQPHTARRGTTGFSRPFANGAIYWCEQSGAQPVWWGIKECFDRLGGLDGRLGFPMTGELDAAPSPAPHNTVGKYQRFEAEWDYPDDVIPLLGGVR